MFEGILSLLNKLPGGSGQPYQPPESQSQAHPTYIPPVTSVPKEVVPDHPMTYAEYKHYNDCVLIGRAIGDTIRNTHNHFQQQRWHDEMMDELRRIGRE